MMTPSELREYEFKGAGRNAYKSDDVDEFFATVSIAYEKMYRENAELVKRVSLLADRLEQYKQDETDIKQAVLSAQKAADIIVKEAEMSVEDSKSEADAILAAAKGEADIIKADAEKQAIADSDLLLSIARDKAEAIINKAKEEAHGILIKANDSASDTVGAANRTVTSESLHYDMLKKEVSEFRASILSQYKAHIEMISKLPELAIEKANEIEAQKKEEEASLVVDVADEETIDNSTEEMVDEATSEGFEIVTEGLEFDSFEEDEDDIAGEDVVKTTLPYDFFEESSSLEFVEDDSADDTEAVEEADSFESGFSVEADALDFSNDFAEEADDADESEENVKELAEDVAENDAPASYEAGTDTEIEEKEYEDIPISKGFAVDAGEIDFSMFEEEGETPSLFDSIEKIDDNKFSVAYDEDDDYIDEDGDDGESKPKFGFFRRKK
ncbi:MAG: DivIVA domain-containing protein [Clostridia bacterium]|nr:DivIVA domain-containing protein [Clostridia bacterium]MBP3559166.1 DivIVA domain-containing protein [Clostridia bacterium]